MALYILRHGQASYQAPTDALRELTERGRQETELIVNERLVGLTRPPVVVSSPYIRAQQTAMIAASLLGLAKEDAASIANNPWSELRSESSPGQTIERISNWFSRHPNRDLLCVSHQPLVGQLIDSLAGLTPGRYMMGTSALACLEGNDVLPGCMDLISLDQP